MKIEMKNFLITQFENFLIWHRKRGEIKKYKNKKRKQIYSSIHFSKNQIKEINDFYKQNYGKKIPLIWHKHFYSYTKSFDKCYFPELLYIPEFEFFMNLNRSYKEVLGDKYVLSRLVKGICKTPENIIVSTEGLLINPNTNRMVTIEEIKTLLKGKVFLKPTTNSGSGKGCSILNIENGTDKNSGMTIEELLKKCPKNFAIQKIIQCSKSISNLNPTSVNTFRIITYRWKNDIIVGNAIMRIGRSGNFVDNAHAGGMFIAINKNGTLHDTAFTEFGESFKNHPDTGIMFNGYMIHNFESILISAKTIHSMYPQIGCVNWDFTIDECESPVLLEANTMCGSIWLPEMAWGKGFFENNTGNILRWLKRMEKYDHAQRMRHLFGE